MYLFKYNNPFHVYFCFKHRADFTHTLPAPPPAPQTHTYVNRQYSWKFQSCNQAASLPSQLRRDKTHFLQWSVDYSSETEVRNSRPPPPPPCLVYTHTLQTLPAKCHLHGYNPFPGLSSGCRLPRVIVPAAGNAVPIAFFTLPLTKKEARAYLKQSPNSKNLTNKHQWFKDLKWATI